MRPNPTNAHFGSPQGSSRSALLFNDLAGASNSTECLRFADDSSIFCFGENLEQLYCTMNEQLKSYYGRLDVYKLSMSSK